MKKLIFTIFAAIGFFMFSTSTTLANTNEIDGPDIIYKQTSSVLLMNDILEMYSYDGSPVLLISDDYTGNGNVPGIYEFKLRAGNITATKEIEVKNVIHEKIIAVTKTKGDYAIHLNKEQRLTEADIVKILERIGLYQVLSNDHIFKITDTYSENYNSPGIYVFELKVVNSNGLSKDYATKIVVTRDNRITLDGDLINMGDTSSYTIYIALAVLLLGAVIFIKRR